METTDHTLTSSIASNKYTAKLRTLLFPYLDKYHSLKTTPVQNTPQGPSYTPSRTWNKCLLICLILILAAAVTFCLSFIILQCERIDGGPASKNSPLQREHKVKLSCGGKRDGSNGEFTVDTSQMMWLIFVCAVVFVVALLLICIVCDSSRKMDIGSGSKEECGETLERIITE